ncbi:transketolase family protein [bacterium]|nr:transketolase family protein [bacterium]
MLIETLSEKIFDTPEMAATRDGFGKGSVEAGKADERVMVLTADLAESTRAEWFQKEFPNRFIEMGVAEQNMAVVASGLANYGKIPYTTSYAAFNPGRNWEHIRTTIALTKLPVIVCGMHAGLQTGADGATHQMLEDIALMRALPNVTVLSPCDAEEAKKATAAAARVGGPVYIRFGREKTPVMTTSTTPFEIGTGIELWRGVAPQVALVSTGVLAYQTLLAAKQLETQGISVVVANIHTIKPIDETLLEKLARECGAVVTVEEHQMTGGLGSAVAETLSRKYPVPQEYIAVQNRFGQSGKASELFAEYGLTSERIVEATARAISRKTI